MATGAGPHFPVVVPAGTRQGTEDGWDDQMPGKDQGMTRSYRGRGRDKIPEQPAKGPLVEEEEP